MSRLILFRGKAGTGKTHLSDKLSMMTKIALIRKDDIFDTFISHGIDLKLNNALCYDCLKNIINTNTKAGTDLIIDIALPDLNGFKLFLSKLNLINVKIHVFHCICSDAKIWEKRINDRQLAPRPNQIFESYDAMVRHYSGIDTRNFEGEIILDSIEDETVLLGKIIDKIN